MYVGYLLVRPYGRLLPVAVSMTRSQACHGVESRSCEYSALGVLYRVVPVNRRAPGSQAESNLPNLESGREHHLRSVSLPSFPSLLLVPRQAPQKIYRPLLPCHCLLPSAYRCQWLLVFPGESSHRIVVPLAGFRLASIDLGRKAMYYLHPPS